MPHVQDDALDVDQVADADLVTVVTEDAHEHEDRGYTPHKRAYLDRLKRIEGQVRGVHRMIDNDVYCIDILNQISAVTSALNSVAVELLNDHLEHCVKAAVDGGDPEIFTKQLSEVKRAIARLAK